MRTSSLIAVFLALMVFQTSSGCTSFSDMNLEEFMEYEDDKRTLRTKRSPMALSYDVHQQFDSGLGQHHVVALTHTISHGLEHPIAHGISHTVSTTAGHGLLQTHPPPAVHHPHAHPHHHKIGYGHGYSLGAYKGYGPPPHSVLGLHYGGFGVGIGYGGHGHGHGFFI